MLVATGSRRHLHWLLRSCIDENLPLKCLSRTSVANVILPCHVLHSAEKLAISNEALQGLTSSVIGSREWKNFTYFQSQIIWAGLSNQDTSNVVGKPSRNSQWIDGRIRFLAGLTSVDIGGFGRRSGAYTLGIRLSPAT
jgi:hypothetical protein